MGRTSQKDVKFKNASSKEMGKRIKKYRLMRGIPQGKFAKQLGISREMMVYIEKGDYNPYKHIGKICTLLNVNPVNIIMEDPDLILTNPAVENLVPVYNSRPSWFKQQPFYYYNAPDWVVHQNGKVIAIEAQIIDKSTLLIDDEGLLFVALRRRNFKYKPMDIVFGYLGEVLKVKRYKDLNAPNSKVGIVLAQERRFV